MDSLLWLNSSCVVECLLSLSTLTAVKTTEKHPIKDIFDSLHHKAITLKNSVANFKPRKTL